MSTDDHQRGFDALGHILEAIKHFRLALAGLTLDDLSRDPIRFAAAERFVEIISEATRRLPASWTAEYADLPWAEIRSIGSVLRHGYDIVDREIIYSLQGEDLDALERVVREMRQRFEPR